VAAGARAGNPLIRIFSEAVQAGCLGHDALRAELAFRFHKHFRKVNRAMTLLRLISVISPLLGLLGTVLGISKVFRVIASQACGQSGPVGERDLGSADDHGHGIDDHDSGAVPLLFLPDADPRLPGGIDGIRGTDYRRCGKPLRGRPWKKPNSWKTTSTPAST
jgi:hypothetical protein